jgi:hypothetical protein
MDRIGHTVRFVPDVTGRSLVRSHLSSGATSGNMACSLSTAHARTRTQATRQLTACGGSAAAARGTVLACFSGMGFELIVSGVMYSGKWS